MPTLTQRARLRKYATGERPWGPGENANMDALDGNAAVGALLATPYEDPSASLTVRVASGDYPASDGSIASYAGGAIDATASATVVLYLDSAGVLTKAGSYPSGSFHTRIATVVAGATTLTSVTDNRQAVGSYAPTAATATRAAHTFNAGPESGADAAATWRPIAAADVPGLDAAKIATGTIAVARLPVMEGAGTGAHAAGLVPDPGASLDLTKFLRHDGAFAAPLAGAGTVTNVGLTGPAIFAFPATPITTAGVLSFTLASQAQNSAFLGPVSGGAGAPTFRPIDAADLPPTGVTPGPVTSANLTIGADGRIYAASNGTGGSGAPSTTKYLIQTADAGVPNAQVLATLTTGILKVAMTTGVLSTAAAGTDYLAPAGDGSALTGITGAQVSGDVAGNAANVTGTVAIAHGGTGQTTAAAAANALLPSQTGHAGEALITDGAGNLSWAAGGGGGGVSSVGLSVPSGLSVSVSTITTSGTFAITTALSGIIKGTGSGFAAATAGTDYLAPTGNGSGLTNLTASQVTNFGEAVDDRVGTLAVAGAGINVNYDDAAGTLTISNTAGTIASTSAILKGNGSGSAVAATAGTDYLTPTGNGSGLTALNASNLGSGTAPAARLGSGTASSATFLRGDGTWAAPAGSFAPGVQYLASDSTPSPVTCGGGVHKITLLDYTLAAGDGVAWLPGGPTLGQIHTVKRYDSGSHAIYVVGQSSLKIDGYDHRKLTARNQYFTVQATNTTGTGSPTRWSVIAEGPGGGEDGDLPGGVEDPGAGG